MASESLIITGFMGVGKSTVGPRVAEKLGYRYFDTDSWMEKEFGIDIPSLVRTDIAAFRKAEAKALLDILGYEPVVVSTGGGIVSTEVGRNALLGAEALVVWMSAPFDDLVIRVSEDIGRERPLFDDIEKARVLYNERDDWYTDTADHSVNALQTVDLVVDDIVRIAWQSKI